MTNPITPSERRAKLRELLASGATLPIFVYGNENPSPSQGDPWANMLGFKIVYRDKDWAYTPESACLIASAVNELSSLLDSDAERDLLRSENKRLREEVENLKKNST